MPKRIIPLSDMKIQKAKSKDKLPCKCYVCGTTFFVLKRIILNHLNGSKDKCQFCSQTCVQSMKKNKILLKCTNCNNEFLKLPNQIKMSKSGNHFCSKSCAATYNNTHKTTGNRRSKLEKYIEIELIKQYPNLEILFNDNKAINSELDIYIPSLKLAFEQHVKFFDPNPGNVLVVFKNNKPIPILIDFGTKSEIPSFNAGVRYALATEFAIQS